ncbi:hypothetical protein B0J17DRAFT_630261 [Rhizoctonia solani]|nr:hypothetical protein B0J17DRAFT_630261 [Rhizoctonia solani]
MGTRKWTVEFILRLMVGQAHSRHHSSASLYVGVKEPRCGARFLNSSRSTTGAYMAEKVIDCLTRFRVINQIRTVCLDRASNNDTFVRELARSLPKLDGPNSRVVCGTHAIDLIARRRIATNSRVSAPRINSSNGDQHASSNSVENLGELDDPEVILDELDGILQLPTDTDEGKELQGNSAIQKAVLASMNHMKLYYGVSMSDEYSREVQDLFPKATSQTTFTSPRLIPSRSPSYETLSRTPSPRALNFREPLMQRAGKMNSDVRSCSGTFYKLTTEQWKLNEEFSACMQVFLEPSLFLLQKEAPVIHEVLPTFSILKHRLERMRDNVDQLLDKHPALRIAAQSSLFNLDEHIGMMAQSEVYFLATAPVYKLSATFRLATDMALVANPHADHTRCCTVHSGQDWVTAYLSSPVVNKESVDEMGASSASAGRTFSGSRTAANYRQHRMNLSTFRAKMAVGSYLQIKTSAKWLIIRMGFRTSVDIGTMLDGEHTLKLLYCQPRIIPLNSDNSVELVD